MEKDIVKAIEAEQKYINDRRLKIRANIYEYLRPYGYDILREFENDKLTYFLKKHKLQLREDDIVGIDIKCREAINNKESIFWIPSISTTAAYVGTDPFDYELAKKLGVTPLNSPHQGGTIICSPGDLSICIHFPIKNDTHMYSDVIFDKLRLFLDPVGIKSSGNDFLFEGKKVIGYSGTNRNDLCSIFFNCSFVDNSELIKKLCSKQSSKIPGFIPNGVITRNQILQEVLSWVDMYI